MPGQSHTVSSKKNLHRLAEKTKGMCYEQFLRSAYWKAIREKVLERDEHKCVICGTSKNLQIHHEHYKFYKQEYKHLECLTTLCAEHHYEYHATVFDFIQDAPKIGKRKRRKMRSEGILPDAPNIVPEPTPTHPETPLLLPKSKKKVKTHFPEKKTLRFGSVVYQWSNIRNLYVRVYNREVPESIKTTLSLNEAKRLEQRFKK